jgi:hypothetical protein
MSLLLNTSSESLSHGFGREGVLMCGWGRCCNNECNYQWKEN